MAGAKLVRELGWSRSAQRHAIARGRAIRPRRGVLIGTTQRLRAAGDNPRVALDAEVLEQAQVAARAPL